MSTNRSYFVWVQRLKGHDQWGVRARFLSWIVRRRSPPLPVAPKNAFACLAEAGGQTGRGTAARVSF